jgi:hypothetical protein
MGRTYTIQYHPPSLRYWLHEHQQLVGSSLALIVVILTAALATVAVSVVRDAIAQQTEPLAQRANVISTTELPSEWSWSLEPINFDHMYRQGEPQEVLDYTRDSSRTYYRSSSE